MNKTFAISFITGVAVFCGSFSSCQDYDPFDYEIVHSAALAREFTQNFESRYGKIDPNHDWGFESLTPVSFSNTRVNVPELNQWADPYYFGFIVPGYPDSEGTYHTVNGFGTSASTGNPHGDVTNEEIQYVSNWFRTHRYPVSIHVHWTDFFIQDISSDYDREISQDGSNCNGQAISNIPEYYINDGPNPSEKAGMQVNGNGTVSVNYGMDKLCCKTFDAAGSEGNGWDHILNFNNGSTNQKPSENVNNTPKRTIMFFTSSGTEDFRYFNSNDGQVYNDWVLVHLVFDIPQSGTCSIHNKACTNHHYDGYYLAFDYQTHKVDVNSNKKSDIYCDGFYSNWIVKLSPASEFKPEVDQRRIFCEDLGNTFDFDFNDVVFDVAYSTYNGKTTALITLKAAGGTLPIYVGALDDKYEAHYLLGQTLSDGTTPKTDVPVNVGNPGVTSTSEPVYRLEVRSTNPDDISIYVKQPDVNNATNVVALKSATQKDAAPQKFCTPVGVRWMCESRQIETSYQYFDSWVSDYKFTNDSKPWFHNDNIVNTSNLYIGDGFVGSYTYDHSHSNQ